MTNDPLCKNDTEFQAQQAFRKHWSLGLPMVNTQINPENATYRTFYLEDDNGFTFTDTLGINLQGKVQKDIVKTETSIMPFFSNIDQDEVVNIPSVFTSYNFIPTTQ